MVAYDLHGMLEFADPERFRLTRQLQTTFALQNGLLLLPSLNLMAVSSI